jgi:hypothetical protein
VFEQDRRSGLLIVAIRLAAAIVASAIVAFFFIVMVPMSQRSDPPKLAENPTVVPSATPTQPNLTSGESQALLQKFLQWQRRDSAPAKD